MSGNKPVLMNILNTGILPLYYCHSQTVSLDIARVLYKAGIRAIEYTNRGSAALENFTAMKKTLTEELPGLDLGIGTVKSKEEAEAFVLAGADFIVSPIVNPAVSGGGEGSRFVVDPGVYDANGDLSAQQLEARVIKLFPANILKPEFLRSILALFIGVKFIPTGGVEIEEKNIRDWYQSGVAAVGMGSRLITEEIMIQGDYELCTEDGALHYPLFERSKKK